MISQNKKDDTDKIDSLMNKILKLENSLNEEEKNRAKFEEKYNQLNNATLPLLNKQLDEKEKLLENALIEQIKLQKEINYLKDNFNINDNFNNITKYIIPEFQDEKDELIIHQTNKIDYLKNSFNNLKKKTKIESENYLKEKFELEKKLKSQEEEIKALKDTSQKNDEKINDLNLELSSLSQINKNLLYEIKTLNDIIKNITEEKEKYQLELNYYKKENESIFNSQQSTLNRIKQLDEDYQNINKTLEEYKIKISEMDTKTYIFKVTSLGRVIEASAELVFNKEGKNNYILTIKYITSSTRYDILEIDNISVVEGEENVILIKYKENKGEDVEMFRTNETNKILKVFKEFQTKAIQHVDIKKQEKEDRIKQKQIKKNVKDMFSLFGN
jgi:chromosome segregation ATPase